MQHIKNLLAKQLKQSGIARNVTTSLVIEEFQKLIKKEWGSNIIKKVKPLYIKNKNLRVACLSSVIVQEINFKKHELIKEINEKFKENVINDIKFTL